MRFLLFLCGLGMVYALVTGVDPVAAPPTSHDGDARPSLIATASGESMRASGTALGEVLRDASGRFHLEAEVHGVRENFLVDTGADTVVLTPDTARRMGIHFDPNASVPVMETANGVGNGHRITIDRMTIAGRTLENVPTIIADQIAINLLGQTALRQLGTMQIEGDRLTFR